MALDGREARLGRVVLDTGERIEVKRGLTMTRPPTCFEELRRKGYKYFAFISWPHAVEERVRDLVRALAASLEDKAKTWGGGEVFLDEKRIAHGYHWDPEIRKQLCRSGAVLVVVTPMFFKSEYCCLEWAIAEELQEHRLPEGEPNATVIVPLVVVDGQDLPEEVKALKPFMPEQFKSILVYSRKPNQHPKWRALVDDIVKVVRGILTTLCNVEQEDGDWTHDENRARDAKPKNFTFPPPVTAPNSIPRRRRQLPSLAVDGNKL